MIFPERSDGLGYSVSQKRPRLVKLPEVVHEARREIYGRKECMAEQAKILWAEAEANNLGLISLEHDQGKKPRRCCAK